MSSEQRIKLRIPTIRGKLFPYYIYIFFQNKISQAMKKHYYEGPTFKF